MAVGEVVRDDRVLRFTRGLSLFIVPFLVVAWAILYLFPDRTAQLWSWVIPVQMTSMVLASAYLGGAYFFVRVARERHWHHTGAGFPAVATFASLLGVATLMHWDKFLHHHVAFWLWAGLYFTTPFLVVGAWLANRRYGVAPAAGDLVLRPGERAVIAVVGVAALVQGVVMFVAPSAVIDLWPWPLTPLTCRVVAAVFCLGGAGVNAWVDPRWSSLRLMLQVEVVMLVLILLGAVRARGEMDDGRALTWPLLLGALGMLVGSAYLWIRYERHSPAG
ncbi:hypothetical protein [Nocardioides cynanchi]|uniref:hypothetical protein n=1 Tax=Nocardioides cynanchi TaxID=2558918 RepID=UPI001248A7D8|nr:hypothetical protein [Nocardioides cynanchi]